MAKFFRQLLIGASVCMGMGAIANSPAFAGTLTNATITGSAPYITYDADSKNTFAVANDPATLAKVLGGTLNNPTGNVELFSNSETLSNSAFSTYTGVTNLSGKIGGQDITLSSLTLADWLSPVSNTSKTLGQTWFDSVLGSNGFGSMVGTASETTLFNIFTQYGGYQRFSDPNIAYVNQDNTGLIRIGLAGHLNATPLLLQSVDAYLSTSTDNKQTKALVQSLRSTLAAATIQASELVKYSYNGQTGYLYGFNGVNSGLVEKSDGVSHSGIYEVTMTGLVPTSKKVPEPSAMLGLIGMGGFLAARRKHLKKA